MTLWKKTHSRHTPKTLRVIQVAEEIRVSFRLVKYDVLNIIKGIDWRFFFQNFEVGGRFKRIKTGTVPFQHNTWGFDYPFAATFCWPFKKKRFRRSKLRSFCSGCFSHSLSTSSTKSSLWHPVRPGKGFGEGGCDGCGPVDPAVDFLLSKFCWSTSASILEGFWSLMAFWY